MKTKTKLTKKKQGIDFDEAKTVFYDDDAIIFDDPDHSMEFQQEKQPKTKQEPTLNTLEVKSDEKRIRY